jgi:Mg-chelatase subunit ChlI
MQNNGQDARLRRQIDDALSLALSFFTERRMNDHARDSVVNAIDNALAALSGKALKTAEDGRLIEELEDLVLRLRVTGISESFSDDRAASDGLR